MKTTSNNMFPGVKIQLKPMLFTVVDCLNIVNNYNALQKQLASEHHIQHEDKYTIKIRKFIKKLKRFINY